MNYGTRKDEHNKLFDKFVYEMFCEPVKEPNVSQNGLCKRSKFLSNPKNLKSKNEPSNEMPPMQRRDDKK